MKPPTYQGELIGTFIRDVTQAIPTLTKSQVRRRLQEILDSQLTSLEEAINPALDDFEASAGVLGNHGMHQSAKEMRENVQHIRDLIKSRREDL